MVTQYKPRIQAPQTAETFYWDGSGHRVLSRSHRTPGTPCVTYRVSATSCECPGFGFRGTCRHIDAYRTEYRVGPTLVCLDCGRAIRPNPTNKCAGCNARDLWGE